MTWPNDRKRSTLHANMKPNLSTAIFRSPHHKPSRDLHRSDFVNRGLRSWMDGRMKEGRGEERMLFLLSEVCCRRKDAQQRFEQCIKYLFRQRINRSIFSMVEKYLWYLGMSIFLIFKSLRVLDKLFVSFFLFFVN